MEPLRINITGLVASFVVGAVAICLSAFTSSGLGGDIIGALGLGTAQVFTLGAMALLFCRLALKHWGWSWRWFDVQVGKLADVAQQAGVYGAAFMAGVGTVPVYEHNVNAAGLCIYAAFYSFSMSMMVGQFRRDHPSPLVVSLSSLVVGLGPLTKMILGSL